MSNSNEILEQLANQGYEYGFETNIEMDIAPAGLNEQTVRFISAKKKEPEWLLEWRLKGLKHFEQCEMPHWQNFEMPEMDFQAISYYAAPTKKQSTKALTR